LAWQVGRDHHIRGVARLEAVAQRVEDLPLADPAQTGQIIRRQVPRIRCELAGHDRWWRYRESSGTREQAGEPVGIPGIVLPVEAPGRIAVVVALAAMVTVDQFTPPPDLLQGH